MAQSKYTDMLSRTAESKMNFRVMRRVFVFQIPTRVFHWLNAGTVLVLLVTGYIIGNPPAIASSTEAYFNNWFGWTRYVHFVAGWIFTFNWMFRLFWATIAGNRWETWQNFIPYKKIHWKEIKEVLIQDIFLVRTRDHLSIGHNALSGLTYFVLFLVSLVMMFTGFYLYADWSSNGFVAVMAWFGSLFGNDFSIRFIHHALMWFFVLFSIIHIYLVFYHDYVEGRGETSSMIGGWKFIEQDCIERHEKGEV